MKKIRRWFKDFFDPQDFNNLDIAAIGTAFNDTQVRALWLFNCFDEIRRINLEVEKRLLNGTQNANLTDLCARRKAYQDVMEGILSARRQVVSGTQEARPNPHPLVDLDRTV